MIPVESGSLLQSLSLRLTGALPQPAHQLLPLSGWLFLALLAASLALLVYFVTLRSSIGTERPPAPWPSILYPLEQWLEERLVQAGLSLSGRQFIQVGILAGTAAAALTLPMRNPLLTVVAALFAGSAPYRWIVCRIRRRSAALHRAALPTLIQMAQLTALGHHPVAALSGAAPVALSPLREELQQALADVEFGMPLADALRIMATRCNGSSCLAQLAESVALHARTGGDLTSALQRLAGRLQSMEELRAEEETRWSAFRLLCRVLLAAALLPLVYWSLTGSELLQLFVTQPIARGLLLWTVVSAAAVASLPYWLAWEE